MMMLCSDAETLLARQSAGAVQCRPVLGQRRQEEEEGQVEAGIRGIKFHQYCLSVFLRASNVAT